MFKKQKAFTVTETIAVLSIVAVLAVLTVCSTINSEEMQIKKIKTLSKVFYSEVEYTYKNILANETSDINIVKLDNQDFDIEADSQKLEELFEKYMDLSPVSCNEIPYNEYTDPYLANEVKCAASNRGVNAGFYLDRTCAQAYQVKEYLEEDVGIKSVENACGYIIYAPKKSKGTVGKDFFIIGLGKRAIK